MKLSLAENIRAFRKNRNMTQEQLAEALGVTVGAVYKWEKGLSTPDIGLILELADLFGTSTDVLLGYEWQSSSRAEAVRRVKELRRERQYAAGCGEAEKLLQKYPNSFALVYEAAQLYFEKGEAERDHRVYDRAIELFERACGLLEPEMQRADDTLSETVLRTKTAHCYLRMGEAEKAVEILQKYNVCGINDAQIGALQANVLGAFDQSDEAPRYLHRAFARGMQDAENIWNGYEGLFVRRGEWNDALVCLKCQRGFLQSFQPDGTLNTFDRLDCVLLELCAEVCCHKGDLAAAREHLREALEKARRFDAAATRGQVQTPELLQKLGVRYEPMEEFLQGKTALECVEDRIFKDITDKLKRMPVPRLEALWQEVKQAERGE
jgi:transcriptional regulator with XRE-family HTH domain